MRYELLPVWVSELLYTDRELENDELTFWQSFFKSPPFSFSTA